MHFKRLIGQGRVVSGYVLAMWILPILVSTVPFVKGILYVYSDYIGLCTWSIDEVCVVEFGFLVIRIILAGTRGPRPHILIVYGI